MNERAPLPLPLRLLCRLLILSAFACVPVALQAQQPAPAPAPAPDQQPTPAAPSETPAATDTPQAAPQPAADTAPAPAATHPPVAAPEAAPPQPAPAANPKVIVADKEEAGGITEDELKQLLVGKELYLRGAYLGDTLNFNEHGQPIGHPNAGSWTLSGVQIEKIRITKHKIELDGARYGLHFLGALPNEDASKAVDRVKITPKKKVFRVTVDREQVVKPKKDKSKDKKGEKSGKDKSGKDKADKKVTEMGTQASVEDDSDKTPEEQVKASIEKAPEGDRPADSKSLTTTTSPAHATAVLREALAHIFSDGVDDQVRASMPQFWKLYFQAQAAGVDYRPTGANILRSSAVDKQARVVTSLAPESNDYAQASGIAGRALYRAVIGADGRPSEVAVVRPIGFGLDENAVTAIGKATFEPALKGGQPVAEVLDLAVLFRIYSKRTSGTAEPEHKKEETPGPYTVQHPPTASSPYEQPK